MKVEDILCKAINYTIVPIAKVCDKIDNSLEKKTGKGLYDRYDEMGRKDEHLREKNPIAWGAKQIGIGVLKGLSGTFFSGGYKK